jgi:tetratricopeptide (TPR) repeat protein
MFGQVMSRLLQTIVLGVCVLLALPLAGAKHEDWFEVRSPHFIVVSNAGEKRAIHAAQDFEQIRSVFRQSIPMVSKLPSPTIIVLALKNEDSMRVLLPDFWAKGHVHPAGYFLTGMDQYYAAVNLEAGGTNPLETTYHEYYHSLTMPYFPNLPLWVAEGLADFYGNTQIIGSDAQIGMPDVDLIDQLKSGQFIPLDRLFTVDRNSPYYNEQNKTTIFYAESWALVHYLMVGEKAAHRQMFVDYLAALGNGASQDEAGAKAFGNLRKLQDSLISYIHNNAFYYMRSKVDSKVSDADFKVRRISEAEANAVQGGFLAISGRTKEAKPLLEQALQEDPKLGLAYQNLGVVEFMDGQKDQAVDSLSKAIELDPKSGLPRYLRASLAFRSGAVMSDNAEIEEDLRVAIASMPDFAPAYSMLAMRLAASPENKDEALQMANRAVALEPGSSFAHLTIAQVLVRMDKFDDAQKAALRARADARNEGEKQQAESFLSYLKDFREQEGRAEAEIAPSAATSGEGPQITAAQTDAGDVEEATGIVIKGSCEMGGPRMDLKTDAGTLVLHAPVSGGIQILMKKPPAGFNPCSSLTGARVNVRYMPAASADSAGTLRQIEVLQFAGAAGEQPPSAGDAAESEGSFDPSAAPGDKTTLEGKVTDLTCSGTELRLTILARGRKFELRARDYSRIELEQETPFESGDFALCTDLLGHQAIVLAVVTNHKPYYGDITSIEVGR